MKRVADARVKSGTLNKAAKEAVVADELPGTHLFGRAAATTNHSDGAVVP